MLLLLPAAFAEPVADADCALPTIAFTSPAPLATDVPIDAVPAGLIEAGNCGSTTWTATLLLGETVIATAESDTTSRLIEVDPGGDLEPNTTYVLRFEPGPGGGEQVDIGFTTGEGTTTGLVGAPSVDAVVASWSESQRETTAGANTIASSAAEGDTILALTVDGADVDWRAASGDVQYMSTFVAANRAPSEVCVGARQRDMAGRWTDAEEVCLAPEVVEDETTGCGGRAVGLLVFVAFFARKRR